jgi:hypothetical protein
LRARAFDRPSELDAALACRSSLPQGSASPSTLVASLPRRVRVHRAACSLLVDPTAGADMLSVVEKHPREIEHRFNARVGAPVEDNAVLAARLDEPAPALAGEVIGDLRLRHAEPRRRAR